MFLVSRKVASKFRGAVRMSRNARSGCGCNQDIGLFSNSDCGCGNARDNSCCGNARNNSCGCFTCNSCNRSCSGFGRHGNGKPELRLIGSSRNKEHAIGAVAGKSGADGFQSPSPERGNIFTGQRNAGKSGNKLKIILRWWA